MQKLGGRSNNHHFLFVRLWFGRTQQHRTLVLTFNKYFQSPDVRADRILIPSLRKYPGVSGNLMKHSPFLKLLFILCSFCSPNYGQNLKVNTKLYRLEKTITQNKGVFKFWRGSTDSTYKSLIIQRIYKGKDTILYDDFIRDGIYDVADRNNDGYKDFVANYHDYDVIYFFDPKINRFKDTQIYMPMTFGLIDTVNKIYYGYRDAQYSEQYDYSILYKYNKFTPYFYYKLIYKTPNGHSERNEVTKIELYRFKNITENNDSLVFVKAVKTKNFKAFDSEQFWKENYKQLLGYR